MLIRSVLSRVSLSAIVAGAVLALGSAQGAGAQEQVIGNAMAGYGGQAGSGAQQMPHVQTGPTLGDIHAGTPPDTVKTGGEPHGQADEGAKPDNAGTATQVPDTQLDATSPATVVDQPQPVLPPSVAPVGEHRSAGVPVWLVALIALGALWLGRKWARGRG